MIVHVPGHCLARSIWHHYCHCLVDLHELALCTFPAPCCGQAAVTHSYPVLCTTGGQYTNLKFQSASLGLGDSWGKVQKAYAAANRALGDIVKVSEMQAHLWVSGGSPAVGQINGAAGLSGIKPRQQAGCCSNLALNGFATWATRSRKIRAVK